MDLTRSQFLRLFAGAGIGAIGLSNLAACGGSDENQPDASTGDPDAPGNVDAAIDGPPIDSPMAGNCAQNGTAVTIGNNHNHAMTVPAADVVAGAEKIYQIQGTSGHPHTVTVTALMFMRLQQNMTVTVTSSLDAAHTHLITIACA